MPRRTSLNLSLEAYGRTVDGAPLLWLPPQSGELDLLLVAGLHGEEPDTTVVLSRGLRSRETREIQPNVGVILCANPDGLSRGTRGNALGIDLNRNFSSANWRPEPASCRWHVGDEEGIPIETGDTSGSEPETAALQDLILTWKPKLVLSLHGPLDCIDDPEASPLGRWLSEKTGSPLVREIGYPTPGSMGSWAAEQSIPLITWEFPIEGIETLSRRFVPILEECLCLPHKKLEPGGNHCASDSG